MLNQSHKNLKKTTKIPKMGQPLASPNNLKSIMTEQNRTKTWKNPTQIPKMGQPPDKS